MTAEVQQSARARPAAGRALGWRQIATAAIIIGACVLPLLVSDYRNFQFTQVIIYAIALMGLNILMGINGQISLGHGAFYAVGAYTAAIMMTHWGIASYLTIPVAGILAFAVGFLFGIPALRLHGLYLALATLALALALPQLLRFNAFEHWTGGVQESSSTSPRCRSAWRSARTSGSTSSASRFSSSSTGRRSTWSEAGSAGR